MTATALAAVGSNANENGTLLISGTAVSASGTSVDFTGIPSWAKRITVMFNGVSKTSTANFLVQLGAGSIDTTGYIGNAVASAATNIVISVNSTAGFPTAGDAIGTAFVYGTLVFTTLGSNIWVASGVINVGLGGYNTTVGGNKTLSGALDRVRITTTNGTDTFDAGTINIMWE